jgi:hypothetical protein
LEETLINNRIYWYVHVLCMNEDRIATAALNTKLKGKHPRWRQKSK